MTHLSRRLLGVGFLFLAPGGAIAEESVDLLIKNALVVTMDADWNVHQQGFVAIRGDRIVDLGDATRLAVRRYTAATEIDAAGSAVLPGLINTHTHIPMVLFRGVADDRELEDWLNNYIFPLEAEHVSRDFVIAGTRLGLAEMIRGGTTTYCDMYFYEDAIAEETSRVGVRAVLSNAILDFPTPDHTSWQEGLAYSERFVERWKGNALITPAIGPHAVYTVSTEHLEQAQDLADRLDVPIVIHLAEAPSETGYTQKHFQARPVTYLDRIGFLSPRVIGAHLVHVNAAEIDILRDRDVGVGHCPQSNMKLASGIAPIPQMLRAGLRVGLGTDGAASNNDLDLWEEMDTAAKLHKVITDDPTVVSARQALEMGTIGGARALHMEDEIGSLEVGKLADLILVDLDAPHLVPRYDIYSHLVYAAKAADVTTTIVNGRVLMRDRRLLTLDEEAAKVEARRYARRVSESLEADQ